VECDACRKPIRWWQRAKQVPRKDGTVDIVHAAGFCEASAECNYILKLQNQILDSLRRP